MYDSLYEESKRLFHPGFLGFESINFEWLLAQFALAVSSFKVLKKLLLCVYPFSVFLAIVSINEFGEMIGFAFVKIKKRISKENFLGELGICVRDNLQGKHTGFALMKSLIALAKNEHVQKIYLTVLADNLKAICMYEKHGFKKIQIMKKGDSWHGKKFDSVEMRLELHQL
jgi:RimJ/RimL family protein N-acetyltransferase